MDTTAWLNNVSVSSAYGRHDNEMAQAVREELRRLRMVENAAKEYAKTFRLEDLHSAVQR